MNGTGEDAQPTTYRTPAATSMAPPATPLATRMRDRQPCVRLEESERAVLAEQELARRRARTARRRQYRRGCRAQPRVQVAGQEGGRGLLRDLLMAPPQRAVPGGDHRDAAAGVRQALDLDVPRMVQVALGKALRPAARDGSRPHGPRAGVRDLGGRPGDDDAFSPPAEAALIATGSPFSRANAATWAAHLRGGTAARDWLVQARRSSGPLAISVVSLTEIGGGMRPPERREVIRLLASMQRFEVTERVAWRAATLMQQYRRSHSGIGPGGYLIAATALTEGLELATLNVRHYPMSRIGAPVLSLRRRSERAAGGHARAMTIRSVGVEEELLLVDPGSGQPLAVAETALEAAETVAGETGDRADDDAAETLAFELQRQQLETNSKPCHDLAELAGELRRCRSLAAEVAGRAGARIAALGTSPAPVVPPLVRAGRTLGMARAFGPIATGQLACGCHV